MTEAQYATLSSYRPRLHLELGSNCIFLQHGPRGWNARIVPGTPGCSAAAAAAAPPLEVSQGPPQPTDSVPAAARIVEGRGLMPFIGVRCANAWCVVGPGAATGVMPSVHRSPTALAQPFAPPTTSKTLIGAWYDEQHLAVWDSVAKRWKPGFIASVVPDPNLRARPVTAYDLGFQQVASLYSPGAPPEKYANGFGYARGWNRIYLRRDSTGAWDAIVIGADSVVHYRTVHLYQHTTGSVPGSVRFEWREDDEWVWIPCDAGCCLVQEGIG
jgi:hypothetical protein